MMDDAGVVIARLYVAMFGKAPDAEGFGYWTGLLDSGQSFAQVADIMFGTSPARAYFPAGSANEDIIASFYLNVLGRQADAGGLAFWTAKLDAAGATPGSVIAEMITVVADYAGSDPAGIASAALFNRRVDVAQFYGENAGALATDPAVRFASEATLASGAAGTLQVATGASGVIDASGYAEINVGAIGSELRIVNVADGAAVVLRATSAPIGEDGPASTLSIEMANSSGGEDALNLRFASTGDIAVGTVALDGIERLFVNTEGANSLEYGPTIYFDTHGLEQATVTGDATLTLYGLDVGVLDTSSFTGDLWAGPSEIGLLLGGVGSEAVLSDHSLPVLFGGGGEDYLIARQGTAAVWGGDGSDTFAPVRGANRHDRMTVEDFQKGVDRLHLSDLMDSYYYGPNQQNFNLGEWFGKVVTGATLNSCLDAAAGKRASAGDPTAFSWFHYGGDTYVVADNSALAGFRDGIDQVVRLVGLIDVSTMHFGQSGGFVPAVLE
jgi:hypothetical protein